MDNICKNCKYAVYGDERTYMCSKYNSVCYSDTPNFNTCAELLGLNDTVTEEELKDIPQTDITVMLIEVRKELCHMLSNSGLKLCFGGGIIGNDEEARKTDKEIYYKVHKVRMFCGHEFVDDNYVIKRYKPSYARLIGSRTNVVMEPVNENVKYVKDMYFKKVITESKLEDEKISQEAIACQ